MSTTNCIVVNESLCMMTMTGSDGPNDGAGGGRRNRSNQPRSPRLVRRRRLVSTAWSFSAKAVTPFDASSRPPPHAGVSASSTRTSRTEVRRPPPA
jgi:hypothetical protein